MGQINLILLEGEFKLESIEGVDERYNGFGKGLYAELMNELPSFFNALIFYQSEFQREDSFAIFNDKNKSIGIQLDPLCEKIVIWNLESHWEFGDWNEGGVIGAIKQLKLMISNNV